MLLVLVLVLVPTHNHFVQRVEPGGFYTVLAIRKCAIEGFHLVQPVRVFGNPVRYKRGEFGKQDLGNVALLNQKRVERTYQYARRYCGAVIGQFRLYNIEQRAGGWHHIGNSRLREKFGIVVGTDVGTIVIVVRNKKFSG